MNPISAPQLLDGVQHRMMQRAEQAQQRLQNLKPTAAGTDAELKAEMEKLTGLFVYQVLQAMRRSIPKSGLLKQGFAHDTYAAFFDQEVADSLARRGELGLTSLLMKQFQGQTVSRQRPESRPAVVNLYQRQSRADAIAFELPVEGRLTSSYGWRSDPLVDEPRLHHGIDIAAPAGATVRAAASGQVVFSGRQERYGNVVTIAHEQGYETAYAHNAVNLVTVGDTVTRGQAIASVGMTGRATGPHVHFEVRKDGHPLDPATLLQKRPQAVKFSAPAADR